MRGIDAVDIEGRIGFCIAELLCFSQDVGEIAALTVAKTPKRPGWSAARRAIISFQSRASARERSRSCALCASPHTSTACGSERMETSQPPSSMVCSDFSTVHDSRTGAGGSLPSRAVR